MTISLINNKLLSIFKIVIFSLLTLTFSLSIFIGYDLLNDGVMITGTYKYYYMSDVWEYIKNFFML